MTVRISPVKMAVIAKMASTTSGAPAPKATADVSVKST